MLISEIKDVRLRKLAHLRRSERSMGGFYEFSDNIVEAFHWGSTEEGAEFWQDVAYGKIPEGYDQTGPIITSDNDPLGLLNIK